MMNRRSSYTNSSTTTGFILKNSSASPKPIMEIAAPPLPRSQSAVITQRNHSFSGAVCQNHDYSSYKNLQRQQSAPFDYQEDQKKQQSINNPQPLLFPVCDQNDHQKEQVGVVGKQVIITSSHHPQHKLLQVNHPYPFTCSGCKEYGAGTCFTCQQCNFELHQFCALAPSVFKSHPLHPQHHLVFYPKPSGKGLLRSRCDVCGKAAKGYIYQCSACNFQLHPSCALLSAKMKFSIHPQHSLIIMPSNLLLSGRGDFASGDALCVVCNRKRSGQVYRCTVCDYYLHAVCAKNMVNGLYAHGIKGLDRPSMFGTAAKIASQVVVGFMGGILEGIGEGLGEALTQNFVKGKCDTNTSTSSGARPAIATSSHLSPSTNKEHQSFKNRTGH